MLSELCYRIQTLGYFNPISRGNISSNDIVKILSGRLINPHKLKNSKSTTKYSFFIANLKEEHKNKQDLKAFEITPYCEWIGHFNRNNFHQIAFMNGDGRYTLRKFDKKDAFEDIVENLWIDCGHFDTYKHSNMFPLLTDVSSEEMLEILNERYDFKWLSRGY